jgi:hypothetical protein
MAIIIHNPVITFPGTPIMPPLRIRIRSHEFTIAPRFASGTVITLGEAQALNQLFSENVRNNVDQWVVNALDASPAGALDDTATQTLQTRIAEYAERYQFMPRTAGRLRPSAIEVEAQRIAAETVVAKTSLTGDALQQAIDQLVDTPYIQRLARERLLEQQALAGNALEELL